MGLKGSVKAFSLDQLFEFLYASGHNGTLRVTHKSASSKTLYLSQGGLYVERSEWSYRLGDVLIRGGYITREQLESALAGQKQKPAGTRLGDVLCELGFTTAEQILLARRKQVEEEVYETFSWEDAFFEFDKDVLPSDFHDRIRDPEEFRYELRSVLMEAARRLDEWRRIHENVPSLKRIYIPEEKDKEVSAKRIRKAFVEMKVVAEPSIFDGRRPVEELARAFGLSQFETLSLLARFVGNRDIRALARHELEARFRTAVEDDLPYAVKLFECALETAEFEPRGKYLDKALFGSTAFRNYLAKDRLAFTGRVRGKRSLELVLAMFRQGIYCDFQATEEGRTLRLSFSKSALVWRGAEGLAPPNVVKHLIARSPIAAADMARVEEMQRQSGRTLQQILVGGGYVTMDNWFRAQKDTVLNEVFNLFFWKKPYLEVTCGEPKVPQRPMPGLDIDVPMLPWLRDEVTEEVRRWESVIAAIPSVRAFFQLTPKGKNALKGAFDVLSHFDGKKPLEEIMKAQSQPPEAFFTWLYEQITSGRIEALTEDDYRIRLDAAIAEGRRRDAIDYCAAAIDSGLQIRYYQDRYKELEAAELESVEVGARPTLRGDLASFSLAEVLQSFYMSKRSGTLRIFETKRARDIYFQDGEVFLLLEGYSSGEHGPDDTATPLNVSGVAETLASQMKDELYEVFLWDAEFEFVADILPSAFYTEVGRTYCVKINTQQFLMEAVRRIAEWEEVRATLPSDDLVLAFESYEEKMRAVTERGLADLLLLIDGRHTLADAIRMSGAGRFQALVLLADLTRGGALHLITEEKRAAKAASSVGRSGAIDGGITDALRSLAGEGTAGLVRATDGRRSKEIVLFWGAFYRTQLYKGEDTSADAPLLDAARDFAECFSWKGARWEFLQGTLPPILQKSDERQRELLRLETEAFLAALGESGRRWEEIAARVSKEKVLVVSEDPDLREKANTIAAGMPAVLFLLDGERTSEDVARACGPERFLALSTVLALLDAGVAEARDPTPKEEAVGEEEWDLGLG
jgi:hypothetical protein